MAVFCDEGTDSLNWHPRANIKFKFDVNITSSTSVVSFSFCGVAVSGSHSASYLLTKDVLWMTGKTG